MAKRAKAMLEIGDAVRVHGQIFILTSADFNLNGPDYLTFQTPEELEAENEDHH